jgi:hypothetical protein
MICPCFQYLSDRIYFVSVQFMLIPLKQGTFDRPYFCETEKIKSF